MNRTSSKRLSTMIAKCQENGNSELFNSYKIQQIEQLRQVFKMYDRDNTGNISSRTLKFLLRGLGDNVNEQEVDIVLKQMDEDCNGTIDFQEFLLYMLQKVNKQSLQDDIAEIFKVLDKQNTSYITKGEIMIHTENMIEKEEVDAFWEEADFEGEGQINYKQFLARILKQ